ncbi:MAG TPA: shikimate kinase [Quisquiliibacterium sp.]|nr:MAG: shikimate kinase [Burkholderiaceae bacterium]HOA92435.1 shikimate kinase [Quisquiliibacterium sp.]HQD81467.1 shikimate kinase [Quisquiliibacterium sp.]HQP65700.1 shikimate kinase [Quisquiliibacterium sp.]
MQESVNQEARPIFLIGMMGSGKSTVGRRLATTLSREFIDADKELEARCGVPITTIFELEGEAGFRRREAALIEDLTQKPGLVLATGGGAVLLEENRRHLHARGLVVYLRATVQELWLRLRNDKVRPLLRAPDPRRRIAELVDLRDPLYRECAHMIVNTGRQPVDKVVREIVERLGGPQGPAADPSSEPAQPMPSAPPERPAQPARTARPAASPQPSPADPPI